MLNKILIPLKRAIMLPKRSTMGALGSFIAATNKGHVEKVFSFFISYQGFRSVEECSKQTEIDPLECMLIREYLYRHRKIGPYYFGANTPPQRHMRSFIIETYPQINRLSSILEVGPGENPIFPPEEFPHWHGVDKYLANGVIDFRGKGWAKDKYPQERIFRAEWENMCDPLKDTGLVGKFDLVVGSHSYEHCFRPIQALKEANQMLHSEGILVLFAPDPFTEDPDSKDPTHTVYLVPEMIHEFFQYAGGYRRIIVKQFRPNADIFISATKV